MANDTVSKKNAAGHHTHVVARRIVFAMTMGLLAGSLGGCLSLLGQRQKDTDTFVREEFARRGITGADSASR